jgi:hypothetical protein
VEIYRGDLQRGTVLGFSTSQFVSLLLVPVSLVMLWRLRARGGAGPREGAAAKVA